MMIKIPLDEKQKILYDLLYQLEYDDSEDDMPNQQELFVLSNVCGVRDCGTLDEAIRLVKGNMDKSLREVDKLIRDSNLVPQLVFTDDDEDIKE